MFDLSSSYQLSPPNRKSTISQYGEKNSIYYKVKTLKKKPYFIRVDEFDSDLFFIKFYPKKMQNDKDKYKKRVGKVNELNRLVATCINLCYQILKKNPDASFGFHGQWDKIDVFSKKEDFSQRYRIYKRAMIYKISSDNFKFIDYSNINSMIIIPNHLYNQQYVGKLKSVLSVNLSEYDLNKLRTPTPKEYKTYDYN